MIEYCIKLHLHKFDISNTKYLPFFGKISSSNRMDGVLKFVSYICLLICLFGVLSFEKYPESKI